MTFEKKLEQLKTKQVTVHVVDGEEYAGTVFDVGPDWLDLDNGPDVGHSAIPFNAIVCVFFR